MSNIVTNSARGVCVQWPKLMLAHALMHMLAPPRPDIGRMMNAAMIITCWELEAGQWEVMRALYSNEQPSTALMFKPRTPLAEVCMCVKDGFNDCTAQ